MYGIILFAVGLVALLCWLVVWRCIHYLADPKGLRKYPNLTRFSGVSDIPFMLLSMKGNRSSHLAELHKTHPVIRVGPNSLSYADLRAIKVGIGNRTKCSQVSLLHGIF